MNQKTTYEHLITEKLQGMPVPDMADAIWARIENQLDTDMPTDDGGTDPDPKNPSGGGWVGGAGLFVFVAALVTIFFINKNHKKKDQPIPTPVQTIQKTDHARSNNANERVFDSSKLLNKKSTAIIQSIPNTTAPMKSGHLINNDTNVFLPPPVTFEALKPDTIQKVTAITPPPVRQDTVKPKKSRGVTGITDNDYRIVPGDKDSAKKE